MTNIRSFSLLLVGGCLVLVSGCANGRYHVERSPVVIANYHVVDRLLDSLDPSYYDTRFFVASVVDINDVERATMFGRFMSESLASRCTQHGYRVAQVTLRGESMVVNKDGDFALSRSPLDLGDNLECTGVVLVGTYAAARDGVHISVKLVRADDATMIAADDYTLPMTASIRQMLSRCVNVDG